MRGRAYFALLATMMLACASSKKPDSKTGLSDDPLFAAENNETTTANQARESKGPQCLDSEGYQITCLGDQDCCPGFYCGFDPEGSQREKTCLFGG